MNPQQPGGPYPPINPNQQQYPPAPQTPVNQYDFILNPEAAVAKRSPLAGGSMMKRILLVVSGLSVLAIVIVIASSLLSSSGSSAPSLVGVAQDQTELIRIATLAEGKTTNQSKLNFAYTVRYSLTTSKQQLLAYMSQNGQKTSASTLTLKMNKQSDQQLTTAIADSTFDAAFTTVVQNDLTAYVRDLQAASATTSGSKGKALLDAAQKSALLLITQSRQ